MELQLLVSVIEVLTIIRCELYYVILLQFFSQFSMYCHLMAYPCVFQNNLFKGCVKKKTPENENTIDILHIYLELTKAVRVVDVFFCS